MLKNLEQLNKEMNKLKKLYESLIGGYTVEKNETDQKAIWGGIQDQRIELKGGIHSMLYKSGKANSFHNNSEKVW